MRKRDDKLKYEAKEAHAGWLNQRDGLGQTAFLLACSKGHIAVVRRLQAAKCDMRQPENEGSSPLHLAAVAGHADVVKLLLRIPELAPDVHLRNQKGATPLDLARAAEKAGTGTAVEGVRKAALALQAAMRARPERPEVVPLDLRPESRGNLGATRRLRAERRSKRLLACAKLPRRMAQEAQERERPLLMPCQLHALMQDEMQATLLAATLPTLPPRRPAPNFADEHAAWEERLAEVKARKQSRPTQPQTFDFDDPESPKARAARAARSERARRLAQSTRPPPPYKAKLPPGVHGHVFRRRAAGLARVGGG